MFTFLSWLKNLETGITLTRFIYHFCNSLLTPPMIWNNCCWKAIVSIIYKFQFNTTFNMHSMYIQYVGIKYVLHHVLQLALRVPKWNVFIYSIYIQYTLNVHSICRYSIFIAPCFAIKSTKMKRFFLYIQYIQYILHHALQYFNVNSLFALIVLYCIVNIY